MTLISNKNKLTLKTTSKINTKQTSRLEEIKCKTIIFNDGQTQALNRSDAVSHLPQLNVLSDAGVKKWIKVNLT